MKHQRHHPHLINESIQTYRVLLLNEQRQSLGETSRNEALQQARAQGKDLILVSPKANPPVCMIGDYGKFLYENNKAHAHQKSHRQKEIQLSATISENDLGVKVRQGQEFLAEGHCVKAILQLRGREKAHPEFGRRMLEQFLLAVCPGKPVKIQACGPTFLAFLR